MKGNHIEQGDQQTRDHQQKAPTPLDDVRVYCGVAFNYKIPSRSNTVQPSSSASSVVVTGRLDYTIGRVLKYPGQYHTRRRFQSLLMIVKAKTQRAIGQSLPTLLAFLASLRQSRLQRHRTDSSVYGVVSDGYLFVFVHITHDGAVKVSRQFDIQQGDTLSVLGCLRYMLEMAAEMSFRDVLLGHEKDDPADPEIDLDDNDYVNPPRDEGEIYSF